MPLSRTVKEWRVGSGSVRTETMSTGNEKGGSRSVPPLFPRNNRPSPRGVPPEPAPAAVPLPALAYIFFSF